MRWQEQVLVELTLIRTFQSRNTYKRCAFNVVETTAWHINAKKNEFQVKI